MFSLIMALISYGYQPERIQASVYMMMFSMLSSLPFIMSMAYYSTKCGANNLMSIFSWDAYPTTWLLASLMVPLAKMPMFGLHFWLPKAHVEASTESSMLLAGIMLKLGVYLLVILIKNMKYFVLNGSFFLLIVSSLGGLFASFMCLMLIDIKLVIALSSISHMSFCIISLSTLKESGILASYMLSLAHGFVSPMMFYLMGNSASMSGSRNMVVMKSMGTLSYSSMVMWFLMCSWNMGCPPSMNLVSEILNLLILMSAMKEMLILIIFMSLFTSFYSVMIFMVKHGSQSSFISFNFNLSYSTSMWLQMWSFMALSLMALANFFALFS